MPGKPSEYDSAGGPSLFSPLGPSEQLKTEPPEGVDLGGGAELENPPCLPRQSRFAGGNPLPGNSATAERAVGRDIFGYVLLENLTAQAPKAAVSCSKILSMLQCCQVMVLDLSISKRDNYAYQT